MHQVVVPLSIYEEEVEVAAAEHKTITTVRQETSREEAEESGFRNVALVPGEEFAVQEGEAAAATE